MSTSSQEVRTKDKTIRSRNYSYDFKKGFFVGYYKEKGARSFWDRMRNIQRKIYYIL